MKSFIMDNQISNFTFKKIIILLQNKLKIFFNLYNT